MLSREREKYRRQVSLDLNVYKSWIEAKNSAGYTGCSDSAFALHLLSLEYRRRYVGRVDLFIIYFKLICCLSLSLS